MNLSDDNAPLAVGNESPGEEEPVLRYTEYRASSATVAILGAIFLLLVARLAGSFLAETAVVAPTFAALLLLMYASITLCIRRSLRIDQQERTFHLTRGTIFHPLVETGPLDRDTVGLIILRRTSRTELGWLETYEVHMAFLKTGFRMKLGSAGTYPEARQILRALSLQLRIPEIQDTVDGILPRRSRRKSLRGDDEPPPPDATQTLPLNQTWTDRIKMVREADQVVVTAPAGVNHDDLVQGIIVVGCTIVSGSFLFLFFHEAHDWQMAYRLILATVTVLCCVMTLALALGSWLAVRLRQHRIELAQDRLRITTVTAGIWHRQKKRVAWDHINDIYTGRADTNGKLSTVIVTEAGYITCGGGLPPEGKQWLARIMRRMWRMHASVI